MPDETPNKPPLPKRPYKRREPKITQTPEEIAHDCAKLTTLQQACLLIAKEKGPPSAAAELNMTLDEVTTIMDSPAGKLFLAKSLERDLTEFARVRARKLRKVGVNRGAIEERLFDLMMMDPAETKGNIDGQVKAAAALADKFGFANKEDPLADKTPAELEAIVAKGHSRLIEGRKPN